MIGDFSLNKEIFFWFNSFVGKSNFLDYFFIFVSKYFFYFILFCFLLFFIKLIFIENKITKKEFIIYFGSIIGMWLILKIFKFFVYAERPFYYFQMETLLKHENFFSSFPSGHAVLSFMLAFAVFFYYKKTGIILILLASLIGIARIFVGVHFPLDIIAGATIGFLVIFLVHRRIIKNK